MRIGNFPFLVRLGAGGEPGPGPSGAGGTPSPQDAPCPPTHAVLRGPCVHQPYTRTGPSTEGKKHLCVHTRTACVFPADRTCRHASQRPKVLCPSNPRWFPLLPNHANHPLNNLQRVPSAFRMEPEFLTIAGPGKAHGVGAASYAFCTGGKRGSERRPLLMAEPSAGEDRTREALGPSLPSHAGPLAAPLQAHRPP